MLRPEELELMVVGQRQLDFQQLEAAARYEGGFHRWALGLWKDSQGWRVCKEVLETRFGLTAGGGRFP